MSTSVSVPTTTTIRRSESPSLLSEGDLPPEQHFIDGEFRTGTSDRFIDVIDPCREEVIARVVEGTADDVDVAVLFDETPSSTLMGPRLSLEGRLAEALGCRVDLTVLNTAPANLVHRVLRDGDLVLERDRSRRIRFEVAKRNEYFDLQPIRDEYRRSAIRRANVSR